MRSVMIAGLPGHFGTWLAQRLPRATVQVAFSADEVVDHARRTPALLLFDASLGMGEVTGALRSLRADDRTRAAPVIVTLEPGEKGVDEAVLDRLVRELGVARVLFHPLDRSELLRAVAAQLEAAAAQASAPAAPPPAAPPASTAPAPAAASGAGAVNQAVAQLWGRARAAMLERAAVVERAARAAADGRLTGALRQQATDEAHRLSGALGTFGLHEATPLARELEARLGGGKYLTPADGMALVSTAAELRRKVEEKREDEPAAPPRPSPAPTADAGAPRLLVLTSDPALADAARAAVDGGGLRLTVAADVASADGASPDAVLLDVTAPDATSDWRALGEVAARLPGVPVLVATARGALPDRLRAVQLGAGAFLQKPVTGGALRDAVRALLPAPAAARPRVLCVDDDAELLGAVRALLEAQRLEVHTLSDPLHFWSRLGEVQPDLVVLDVEMPYVNGIELCRVVRADPRWRALPVLFLTARTEPETVYRVFAAGADDYVGKPLIGPELIARIRNRLERARR